MGYEDGRVAMRYEEKMIDEVQALNDIVDVVSGYLPLKRSGRTLKALCPFHQEKTASFIVHPEKQIFHCFGCGVGGNVISFVMKYEKVTFPEALRSLADRVHFKLPEPVRGRGQEVSDSEAIYEIYRLAHEYYSANAKHPEKGRPARDYLIQRGFDPKILEEFPLGWATSEWRELFEFLSRRGVQGEALYRSGLIQRTREGNPYDLFRARLIFPIHNLQGKVVAFGGRSLGDETPKYLNSPESPIFRKRKELFGLPLAKRFLTQEEGRILVVEGYFDFLRVYFNGIKNVVATLGTALTEDHVRILKRFVPEVVVVFDGDRAGESAALRGVEVFLEGEMSVKVATLPSGKDPDSLIGASGVEEFKKLLLEAQDLFDFKWETLTRRYSPADTAGLIRISNEFLETFSKVKNQMVLDRYLKRLARLLNVEESSLRRKLAEIREKLRGQEVRLERGSEGVPAGSPTKLANFPYPEEGVLVSLLLEDPALLEKGDLVCPEDLRHPGAREVFQILKTSHEAGTKIVSHQVLNRLEDESIEAFVAASSLFELSREEREKAFSDCVRKIRERRTREHLERLQQAIRKAEDVGEPERLSKLLNEYRTLLAQRS